MADCQLSYTGDQVNTAIGQIVNKNITGTVTIDALDLTTPLSIANGGTGATTAAAAREALGVKSCGTYDILPVARGGTGKTTAAEALKALGGVSWTKLWENASSTSGFAAQTISLDLSEYDSFAILHRLGASVDSNQFDIIKKGMNAYLIQLENASYASVIMTSRNVKITDTGITFGAGYSKTIYSSSAGGSQATSLIPLAVYGVKGVMS